MIGTTLKKPLTTALHAAEEHHISRVFFIHLRPKVRPSLLAARASRVADSFLQVHLLTQLFLTCALSAQSGQDATVEGNNRIWYFWIHYVWGRVGQIRVMGLKGKIYTMQKQIAVHIFQND